MVKTGDRFAGQASQKAEFLESIYLRRRFLILTHCVVGHSTSTALWRAKQHVITLAYTALVCSASLSKELKRPIFSTGWGLFPLPLRVALRGVAQRAAVMKISLNSQTHRNASRDASYQNYLSWFRLSLWRQLTFRCIVLHWTKISRRNTWQEAQLLLR